MTAPGSRALDAPAMSPERRALEIAIKALDREAGHFDEIARKALYWMRVVERNEIAEARWSGIKNHAFKRASECRASIATIHALVPDAGEPL